MKYHHLSSIKICKSHLTYFKSLQIGISSQKAIAHHLYAISLILDSNENEKRDGQKSKYIEAKKE